MYLYYVRAYNHKNNTKSRWWVSASTVVEAANAVQDQLGGEFRIEHTQQIHKMKVTEIILEEFK
jgi:hypothetical protein